MNQGKNMLRKLEGKMKDTVKQPKKGATVIPKMMPTTS